MSKLQLTGLDQAAPAATPNPLAPHGFVRLESKGGPVFLSARGVQAIGPAAIGQVLIVMQAGPPVIAEAKIAEVAAVIAAALGEQKP